MLVKSSLNIKVIGLYFIFILCFMCSLLKWVARNTVCIMVMLIIMLHHCIFIYMCVCIVSKKYLCIIYSHTKLMKRQALSKKSMNGLKRSSTSGSASDTSVVIADTSSLSSIALAGTEPISYIALAGTEPISSVALAGTELIGPKSASNVKSSNNISSTAPMITQGGTIMIHDYSDSSADSLSGHADSTSEKIGTVRTCDLRFL